MSWIGAAIGAVGVVGGILGAREARKGRESAESNAALQYELGREQLDLSREQLAFQREVSQQQLDIEKMLSSISAEQWETYKTEALPLIKDLAGMASVDRTDERVASAAGDVKSAFATGREAFTRALERTRSPADPGYGALLAPTYMDEAAAVSQAVTNAREEERNRRFDRTAQAVQAYQGLPTQAVGAGSAAVSSAANRSGVAANLSGQSTRNAATMFQLGNQSMDTARAASGDAAQAVYGGVTLGLTGLDWYRRMNPSQGYNPSASFVGQDLSQPDFSGGFYAEGGRVRGPGTETSDSVPARLSKGEYVIPADVVRAKGQEFFDKMLQKYHRPVMGPGRGEMANGGPVVKGRGLPRVVDEAIFRSLPTRAMSRSRR